MFLQGRLHEVAFWRKWKSDIQIDRLSTKEESRGERRML